MISCFQVPAAVHPHPPVDPTLTRARILRKSKKPSAVDRLLAVSVGMSLVELSRLPVPEFPQPRTVVYKQPCKATGNRQAHCVKLTKNDSLDLPDGSCFNRSMLQTKDLICLSPNANYSLMMQDSAIRECQYMGSFPVADASGVETLRDQLNHRAREESAEEGRQVLVLITLTGLKICSPQNKAALPLPREQPTIPLGVV